MSEYVLNLIDNPQNSEFYPTPPEVIDKMLSGVDFNYINSILEPSAGKGDILRVLAKKEHRLNRDFDIDCIEIDANLRQILRYNFGERKDDLHKQNKEIREKYHHPEHHYRDGWVYYNEEHKKYIPIPNPDRQTLNKIDNEINCYFFSKGIHIVHDDFLTYAAYKKYDLIIMNPPFSNGDIHLLKALKMQEKGGNIICLLNAETIKNPYTETRKELIKQLEKHNAIIEYIEKGFVSAERRTGVEVALIKVAIESVQEESEIYERMQKAEQAEDFDFETTELDVADYIKSAINHFNIEVKSGLELIRQYKALAPYIQNSFSSDYKKPILRLINHYDRSYDDCVHVNDYLRDVRAKYWGALLDNPKFVGKLTSKLQTEYRKKVDNLKEYDFTEFNIKTLLAEMNTQIKKGIEDEIVVMYDRLTEEHSWYPECQKNRHYYNGWKTNKAHKIDKKVIIPTYGVFDGWDGMPRVYKANEVLADIERILNYLDGGMTTDVDMEEKLQLYFSENITKNIPLKYFKATFYKKGTVHLTFSCPELIERFNIYAGQRKGWLPPSYGKKAYTNMTEEEKAVIDSFQGETAYNEVMAKANYYLSPVTNKHEILMLGE